MTRLTEMEGAPLDDNNIRLIHFFVDKAVIEKHKLENRSPFYDCDREWLKKIGLDIAKMDQEFDDKVGYLVAIPTDSLRQWIGTKSWLKLSQAGSLDHAAIITLPKDKIIFRDHTFVEQSFVDGDEDGGLAKKYYESTDNENRDFKMAEAWIPQSIDIQENKILQFDE